MNGTYAFFTGSVAVLAIVVLALWRTGTPAPIRAIKAFIWSLIVATVLVGISAVIAGIIIGTWPAEAHQAPKGWSYPLSCCSNYDCRPTTSGEVQERPEGYVVSGTGEVVGYQDKRIRNSPDGDFHWCAHQSGVDAGRTICLFVPPRSF